MESKYKNILEDFIKKNNLNNELTSKKYSRNSKWNYYYEDFASYSRKTLSKKKSYFINLHECHQSATQNHSHNFNGAFQVLEGKFIELEFEKIEGNLKFLRKNIFLPGDYKIITKSDRLFHKLYKVGKKNTSLVCRDYSEGPSQIAVNFCKVISYDYNQKLRKFTANPSAFSLNDTKSFLKTLFHDQKEFLYYTSLFYEKKDLFELLNKELRKSLSDMRSCLLFEQKQMSLAGCI